MIQDVFIGMTIMFVYNSYIEAREYIVPDIIYTDNKGFLEIKYVEKDVSVYDVFFYIINNNVKKIFKL